VPTWAEETVNEDLENLEVQTDDIDESRIEAAGSFNLEGVDPEKYYDRVEPALDGLDPNEYVNVAIYLEDADHLIDLLEDRKELAYYFYAAGFLGDLLEPLLPKEAVRTIAAAEATSSESSGWSRGISCRFLPTSWETFNAFGSKTRQFAYLSHRHLTEEPGSTHSP